MTPWIIGNWKLNPQTTTQACDLVGGIVANSSLANGCQLMVAPSFLHLDCVASSLTASAVKLVSQDVSALTDTNGAFTGDVSAIQLKNTGCEWVIIGHSERRQYYQESNQTLLAKLQNCANQNLGVIFCIGESETEFDAGSTKQVLQKQLAVIKDFVENNSFINGLNSNQKNLIVAYEPVWAIGTGKVPSVEQVADVHEFIRELLVGFNTQLASAPIIYGGSVKPNNAKEFASCPAINGVLVGGAALDANSFIQIANSFCEQ